MKRVIAVLLLISVVFSISACGLGDAGKTVKVQENGVYVDYTICYDDNDTYTLIRNMVITLPQPMSEDKAQFIGSSVETYLEKTLKSALPNTLEPMLCNVAGIDSKGEVTQKQKEYYITIPSATEMGFTDDSILEDGTAFQYFTTDTRIAYNEKGQACVYLTRSLNKDKTTEMICVSNRGGMMSVKATQQISFRPIIKVKKENIQDKQGKLYYDKF